MAKTSSSFEFAGKTLSLEIGEFAPQATASVLARLGDTMVLATVVAGNAREDIDYFPLSVEYMERLYAGGKIKGSRWVKREGRPSDDAILIGRLIDRSIRPLFPKEYKNEVQVTVTVLSVDGENEPDILAMIAVSAVLAISPIPWNGPIGAIRMGYVKENGSGGAELIHNPTSAEIELSDLDLIVSQVREKTVMIEAGAKQVPEEVFLEAVKRAHEETASVISFIEDLVKKVGQKKLPAPQNSVFEEAIKRLEKAYKEDIVSLISLRANKEGSGGQTEELVKKIYEQEKLANPSSELDKKLIAKAIEHITFKVIKSDVVKKKKRPDGRAVDEIREITVQVGLLPRTHGSALFQRGLTQALTIATLGSPRLEQLIESAEGEESKRYIHHYSMPPYSVGEAGRMGTPSRREIGHGALAERAMEPVIPTREKFPYTIRVVSEILSSNGSTSMAATCGSTLALMDAGVPILKPVAGISVGMMSLPSSGQADDDYVLLTDIIGLEDFSGDMDFKVAGTDDGITAVQLDVKIPGLTVKQVEETIAEARKARLTILEKMHAAIASSRQGVSAYAPKIEQIKIPVDKIGEVIGPGGRVIKQIISQTGAAVDVEDDGTVTISGTDDEAVKRAYEWVHGITRELTIGEEFEGQVKRILPFGAFVEVLPGKEGMVHVSKMGKGFVKSPEDVVSIGEKVKVKVIEVDEQGRINLALVGQGQDEQQPTTDQPQAQSDQRPFQSRPARSTTPVRGDRADHPLSRQFHRERMGGPKKRFSR